MAQTTLTIIIINYNTPELVYNCLRSINKYVNFSYEVILVDNGSRLSRRMQQPLINQIITNNKLVISEKNLGFGKGNNLGASNARGNYLWFLNSDTLLVDDSVTLLVKFLETHSEIGALSPLLYDKNNVLQKNFFASFQSLFSVTFRRHNDHRINFNNDFFYTDIVVGAALMIRKSVFDKIGGFDKNIFMYLEDDDLCKQLENAGYKNAVFTKAKITHLEGKSTKNTKYKKKLYYASQTYFWRKHNGFWPTLIMRILRWPYKLIKLL